MTAGPADGGGFTVEVHPPERFAAAAARRIADGIMTEGSVVLTGGTTAEKVYPELAGLSIDWTHIEVFFSDERCVPPDDDASNFAMAKRLLLGRVGGRAHRMRGEDPPEVAAASYHAEIAPWVERGLDLVILGMGADCHVGALFPGSPALEERSRMCVPVTRPDGLGGLTLTTPAMRAGVEVLVIVSGETKAEAVRRVVQGDEPTNECPARLLADRPDVTFVLDEPAASLL